MRAAAPSTDAGVDARSVRQREQRSGVAVPLLDCGSPLKSETAVLRLSWQNHKNQHEKAHESDDKLVLQLLYYVTIRHMGWPVEGRRINISSLI